MIDARLRRIDLLIARGAPLAVALKETGVRGQPYLWWRAAYGARSPGQVRELMGRPASAQPAEAYIGRALPGLCPVCGQAAGFAAFSDNVRESGLCLACGSTNRQRQMAYMLRMTLGQGQAGPLKPPRPLALHNTESTGPIHDRLQDWPGYTFSEYWSPEHQPGEVVNGIRHEDLQALSFADASLDLMLSSDVLEHMPRPYDAHAEIFRTLKPGGRHIFTVPFAPRLEDDVRARLVGDEIEYLADKVYHGDPIRPDEGVLVWTVFGLEMLDRLRTIGFQSSLWVLSKPEFGIVGDAVVFEAFKPAWPRLPTSRMLEALALGTARPAPLTPASP